MGKLDVEHPELLEEWDYEKNGELSPKDVTAGSHKKVWWQCEKGHEWQATVGSRSQGRGCPYCSGQRVLSGINDLATTNPDLAKEWHPTKNGELSPKDVTAGSSKKVWWQCDKGHEWQAPIANRTRRSCPYCSNQRVWPGFNDLSTTNPDLAKEWHPTKNGELSPKDVTAGSGKKVWWQCDKGHEWQAPIANRNTGGGCPVCGSKQVLPGFNDLATVNPDLAKEWHPTKNGDLTPQDVTTSSNKKVWWQCNKGHEWQASPNARTAGRSCPYCSNKKVWPGSNDLATLNPELAKEWHPTKNGDLTPQDVTTLSNKKIWWKCNKGHEWQAVISNRSRGDSCPYCSGHRAWSGYNDLATLNPDLAKEWHPTKNGELSPKDVTAGSNKKVWWQCNKGHEWQATVVSRSAGSNCPICNEESQTSFPEQAILYYLSLITEVESRSRIGDRYEADIFLPKLNTAIEYDGWYWHKGSESSTRESAKNEYMAKLGIRLIRVKEIDPNRQIPDDTLDEIYCRYTTNGEHLRDVIYKILQRLEIVEEIDVNPARDASAIYSQYIKLEKENSLANKLPKVAKEWHPTKNGSLTPDLIKVSSNKNVWWQCNKGHEWQASPNARSGGDSCPYCSGHRAWPGYNDLATLNPELAKEWHPTKNGELSPKDVTAGSGKKVWWQCNKGHEWQATIASRSAGRSCPYCSNKKVWSGFNDLATIRPDLAKEWHPDKNGELTPEMITISSGKKVWWQCNKGHEWQATVYKRTSGRSCPYCSGNQVLVGFNDLATVNPELVKEWHPAKNGELSPKEVTAGSGKKIWWKCDKGHEWQATVASRSAGSGCPVCAGRQVLTGFNDLATVNPDLAVQWHPTKNGNLTPKMITISSGKKVWWQCDKGHEWQATVASRSAGRSCPYCSNKKAWPGFNDLATTNPEIAAQWHPTKNGNLTPQDVTAGSHKKIWWKCKKGHQWQAKVENRTAGNSCPTCKKEQENRKV